MKSQKLNSQYSSSHADDTDETLWWSRRPVPKRHTRLRTGEPVSEAMFKAILANILLAVMALETEHPYKAWRFVGKKLWRSLGNGDRRRAGRVLADLTRRPGSPIGLIRRGKNQSHRYFVRSGITAEMLDSSKLN